MKMSEDGGAVDGSNGSTITAQGSSSESGDG